MPGARPGSSSDGQPAAKKSRADEEEEGANFDELNEDELVSLKDWQAAKQASMQAARQVTSQYVEAKCRGSQWIATKRGVGAYVAVGVAMDADAPAWATLMFGQKMSSYSMKLYGEELASALACLWADRMEYWYTLHLSGQIGSQPQIAKALAAAPPPDAVEALLATDPALQKDFSKMLRQILALKPTAY